MQDKLSQDEYDALHEIARGKQQRPSACVLRNAKRLSGLKFVAYLRDGRLQLTEKGQQTLFLHRAIEGLRAVADGAGVPDADVLQFLLKKGHVEGDAASGLKITTRGAESLADIDRV